VKSTPKMLVFGLIEPVMFGLILFSAAVTFNYWQAWVLLVCLPSRRGSQHLLALYESRCASAADVLGPLPGNLLHRAGMSAQLLAQAANGGRLEQGAHRKVEIQG
jgi:hypothetical protein